MNVLFLFSTRFGCPIENIAQEPSPTHTKFPRNTEFLGVDKQRTNQLTEPSPNDTESRHTDTN